DSRMSERQMPCGAVPQPARALLSLDDRSPTVLPALYQRALLLLIGGHQIPALILLERFQETNELLTEDDRQFLYALPQNEQEIEAILPRSVPKLEGWVKHFSNNDPEHFEAWRAKFAVAASVAIERLVADHRHKALDDSLYFRELLSFSEVRTAQLEDRIRS